MTTKVIAQPSESDTARKLAEPESPSMTGPSPATETITQPGLDQVLTELSELRAQIASLSADLDRLGRKDA